MSDTIPPTEPWVSHHIFDRLYNLPTHRRNRLLRSLSYDTKRLVAQWITSERNNTGYTLDEEAELRIKGMWPEEKREME